MRHLPSLSKIEMFGSAIAAALCLYFVASFCSLILANFWPGPLFDYWIDIPLIIKSFTQTPGFLELASAHNNAHRILIPRLLFILDYRYFAGTNILLVSVSLLCKISTLLLFNILLAKPSLPQRLWLNALLCAGIFNAGNVYNVVFNFDIQWDLASVFACAAIFFYTRHLTGNTPWRDKLNAYLFLTLAFFSHAGALSLPLVFIMISLLNKKIGETALNVAIAAAVFYLHQVLPAADPENPDSVSALITLLLHTPIVVVFIAKFISAGLVFYLGNAGYYVSVYIFALLVVGIVFTIKNRHQPDHCSRHVFLYIAVFLFLMITTIAAARSVFSPNIWAASRFQTTVLLFVLCLHIHLWLVAGQILQKHRALLVQSLLALHALLIYGLLQYFTYNIPYKLGNAVFFSHAYMLTHERNHNNAPRLLLWIHEQDVIADSDPFFRRHALAWYADKQVNGDFVDAGKQLLHMDQMPAFRASCRQPLDKLDYHWTPDGGIEFSVPVHNHLRRKTWYAIDNDGGVVGFAYLFANESGFLKNRSLQGYSLGKNIAFFAEVGQHQQVQCLYAISVQP